MQASGLVQSCAADEKVEMAREFVERLTYQELERMAKVDKRTANDDNAMEELFGKIKRKLSQPFVNMEQYMNKVSNEHNRNHRRRTGAHGSANHGTRSLKVRYEVHEKIELAHFDYMFSTGTLRDKPQLKLGEGHEFALTPITNPTFCDYCGDLIWGMTKKCLKCSQCKYTCHHRCRQLITLDCEGAGNEGSSEAQASCSTTEESTNGKAMVKESGEFESGYETNDRPDYSSLPKEDIRRRIEEFNSKNTNHGLLMEMREDGLTFQGFIRVNMNLTRPINMSIGVRPPSIYDVLTHEDIEDDHTQTTSFYLPRDTVKALHITSDTTTREVISLLLHKFHITDNPHKFALYHHFIGENNKLQIRKLPDGEKPLQLWLKWEEEESESQWKLVLQENETGEIMWEAFSIPELSNFLEILDREEKEHIEQLRTKYKVKKLQLNARVREIASEANDRGESTA